MKTIVSLLLNTPLSQRVRLLPKCILLVSIMEALVSCGGGGDAVGTGDVPGDRIAADGQAFLDVLRSDTLRTEIDGSTGDAVDAAGDVHDGASPGGFGEPCNDNGDCVSGYCVAYLGEKVCTTGCVEDCPQGWKCTEIQGGREPVWLCMSDFAHLCLPCKKSTDCTFGSVGGVACVSYGPDGAFCGAGCETDEDCPAGFVCRDTTTTEGAEVRECMVPDGLCPCGGLAEELGIAALCFNENEWGTCTGKRVCVEGALTDCDASIPEEEICNDEDDNCNGDNNEGLVCCVCGDGVCHDYCEGLNICGPDCAVCGDGICSPSEGPCVCYQDCCGFCGDQKCAKYTIQGQQCCNETTESCPGDCKTSTCGNEQCEPGENPIVCPQDCETFFCGDGICMPNEGPESETPCPQDCSQYCGNCTCEAAETFLDCPMDCGFCGDSVCSPCPALLEKLETCPEDCCIVDCEDKNCGPDGCGSSCGLCDDGNLCTTDECIEGICIFDTIDCNDNNQCTTETCDPVQGCQYELLGGQPCDDGNECTTDDACYEGQCQPWGYLDCDDGLKCTVDACDPMSGCVNEQLDCNDEDACTDDHCEPLTGECINEPIDCDDENPCTGDTCDPLSGCVNEDVEDDTPCGEGPLAICQNGQCQCESDCEGKTCGPNGCGSTCGPGCTGNDVCIDGGCQDIGLVWVQITGGEFQMGCVPSDTNCLDTAKPQHAVTVSSFFMLETEVTEAQYFAVTGKDPSCDHNGGGGDNSPVECVNWDDALSFCEAIGGRLPTEAEWEYAARAGGTTKYICGSEASCLGDYVWFYGNSNDGPGEHKHNVKGKLPNDFGLYDMMGNVWEMVSDCFHGDYTDAPSVAYPGWDADDCGSSTRTIRGGSFMVEFVTYHLSVSLREITVQPVGFFQQGFRCARPE